MHEFMVPRLQEMGEEREMLVDEEYELYQDLQSWVVSTHHTFKNCSCSVHEGGSLWYTVVPRIVNCPSLKKWDA